MVLLPLETLVFGYVLGLPPTAYDCWSSVPELSMVVVHTSKQVRDVQNQMLLALYTSSSPCTLLFRKRFPAGVHFDRLSYLVFRSG
jgi:hypothetical protein